ncbi:UNVERIFIED_CONTAM: hypothetical protein Slati_4547000 [Sesamum latifolium]|uniref:Uncharacterized protein n=1 Tax=Sesamum latifolium TaxID=2727402 RepID=A0AAW2S2H8_9LAMI
MFEKHLRMSTRPPPPLQLPGPQGGPRLPTIRGKHPAAALPGSSSKKPKPSSSALPQQLCPPYFYSTSPSSSSQGRCWIVEVSFLPPQGGCIII